MQLKINANANSQSIYLRFIQSKEKIFQLIKLKVSLKAKWNFPQVSNELIIM